MCLQLPKLVSLLLTHPYPSLSLTLLLLAYQHLKHSSSSFFFCPRSGWHSCCVCSLDVTWSCVLTSNASRVNSTHHCRYVTPLCCYKYAVTPIIPMIPTIQAIIQACFSCYMSTFFCRQIVWSHRVYDLLALR